jgi:hypothetical protein
MPSKPIVPLPSTLLRASAFAWPLLSTIFRFSDSHALEKQHSRWAMIRFPDRKRARRALCAVGEVELGLGGSTSQLTLGRSPTRCPDKLINLSHVVASCCAGAGVWVSIGVLGRRGRRRSAVLRFRTNPSTWPGQVNKLVPRGGGVGKCSQPRCGPSAPGLVAEA